MRSTNLHAVLASAVAVSALLALGPTTWSRPASAVAPQASSPAPDPFYTPPTHLGAFANGQAIRSRSVTVTMTGVPLPITSWQVLYKSMDAKSHPTAEVVTIMIPTSAYSGGGARPLLSYQFAEDSVGAQCAPSYTLRQGTTYEESFMEQALAKGWAVVSADYEGPQSQLIAGAQEGHGVLDGIRAALRFAPAGFTAATPLAMWGYSGGAYATGAAAELQASYAPELHFAGIATGGMPVSILHSAHKIDDGSYAEGLVIGGVIGLDRAFPEMGIAAALNAKGRKAFADSAADCLQNLVQKYAFTHLSDYTTMPNPLDFARFQPYLAADSLGLRRLGHSHPTAPFYSYHAISDELIPVADADALMAQYCAAGVAVDRVRAAVGEHLTEEGNATSAVLTYLTDRFAGRPAPTTCH